MSKIHDNYIAPLIVGIILIIITAVVGMNKCNTDKQSVQDTTDRKSVVIEVLDSTQLQDIKKEEPKFNNLPTTEITKKEEDTTIRNVEKIPEKEIIDKGISIIEKGEGFGEDMFDKDEARKSAKEMAMNELFSKFPKIEESVIRRYAKTVRDTVEKTKFGTWKAYITLSIKESDIK